MPKAPKKEQKKESTKVWSNVDEAGSATDRSMAALSWQHEASKGGEKKDKIEFPFLDAHKNEMTKYAIVHKILEKSKKPASTKFPTLLLLRDVVDGELTKQANLQAMKGKIDVKKLEHTNIRWRELRARIDLEIAKKQPAYVKQFKLYEKSKSHLEKMKQKKRR